MQKHFCLRKKGYWHPIQEIYEYDSTLIVEKMWLTVNESGNKWLDPHEIGHCFSKAEWSEDDLKCLAYAMDTWPETILLSMQDYSPIYQTIPRDNI